MLTIRITKITPLYPHRIFIQWDLINPVDSGSYTFTLERCGSVEGPWEVLKTGIQNTYNYIDDMRDQPLQEADGKPHLYSLQKQFYYRVTVVPPSGCQNKATSDPHCIEKELSPIAKGLRRRLQYDLTRVTRYINGVRLSLLKRKLWGTRCPICYDPVTRSETIEHCTTCYGTTFIGGYWDPFVTYGRINTPYNINSVTSERDKTESATQIITLLDYPLLQDNDLIVELDTNQRHLVRKQTTTELRRVSVHQQVTTSIIERGAIEYSIPVDLRIVPPLL